MDAKVLDPLKITLPDVNGVSLLAFEVSNGQQQVLSRNFMYFIVSSNKKIDNVEVISTPAGNFSNAQWSKKQWNVLEGKKVNGAGKGSFEYTLEIPADFKVTGIKEVYFLAEVSAKELFVKDQEEYKKDQDFMKGSLVANSSNPNSYPMTDETYFPSRISVSVNGAVSLNTTLKDDPADHRGVLSWHNQLQDRKLREAGSYGYLVKVPIRKRVIRDAMEGDRKIKVQLRTEGEGGIAIYGKDFGRYRLDPCLVIKR